MHISLPTEDINVMTIFDRWKVTSQNSHGDYFVTRRDMTCEHDHCFSKCLEVAGVGLCGHLYFCTCRDNSDLCQHIHEVHSLCLTQKIVNHNNEFDTVSDDPVFYEPTSVINVSRRTKDLVPLNSDKLDTIKELCMDNIVKELLLPPINGVLDELVRKCKAVKSSDGILADPMDI